MGGRIRFVINTGDLFYANYDDGPKVEHLFKTYAKNMPVIQVPLFNTIGNHDYVAIDKKDADTSDPGYAYGLFTKHLGPARWSFTYAGAHFVGLDWASLKEGRYVNAVSVAWLEEDLKLVVRGTPIFIFIHYPSGDPRFWEVAAKYGVTQVFAGHSHRRMRFRHNGVPALTTINLRGNGPSTLGIVTGDGLLLVDRCPGCKATVMVPAPGVHVGMTLGDFRLESKLGAGGMGEVYLATQLSLNRPVAVKVLPPAMTKDPETIARFGREVKMQARLSHPNIVTALKAGEEGGIYYLAMQYVDGEDLDGLLEHHGCLAEAEALRIIREVALGLAFVLDLDLVTLEPFS